MRIEESGHAEVALSHRGNGYQVAMTTTAGIALAMTAFGLIDGHMLTSGASGLDIALVVGGGSLALVTVPLAISSWFWPRDSMSVGRPVTLHVRGGLSVTPTRGGGVVGAVVAF